jgi:hypothetical protein
VAAFAVVACAMAVLCYGSGVPAAGGRRRRRPYPTGVEAGWLSVAICRTVDHNDWRKRHQDGIGWALDQRVAGSDSAGVNWLCSARRGGVIWQRRDCQRSETSSAKSGIGSRHVGPRRIPAGGVQPNRASDLPDRRGSPPSRSWMNARQSLPARCFLMDARCSSEYEGSWGWRINCSVEKRDAIRHSDRATTPAWSPTGICCSLATRR